MIDSITTDNNYHMSTKTPVKYYEDKNGNFGLIFKGGMDARTVLAKLKKAYGKVYKSNKQTAKRHSTNSVVSSLQDRKK